MKMYESPKQGTYNHKTPNFDGTFNLQQVKVDVLGESEKQYLIRLILPVGHHRQNDQMKVRKHNVRLHDMTAQSKYSRNIDYTTAYWQI